MKREAQLRLIVTFYTTAEVMATEKVCRNAGLEGRIIPVPRSLTSDCGMAWCAAPECREALENLLVSERIEYAGIFELML